MRTRFVLCVGVLGLGVGLAAQPPTTYTVKFFNQGATSPFTTATLPAGSFTCATTPKLSGSSVNPNKLAIDDPANPTTADCVYTDPGTGPLLALPFGTTPMVATIAVTNTAGTSPDSSQSAPFTRPGPTAPAPTGLRVIR